MRTANAIGQITFVDNEEQVIFEPHTADGVIQELAVPPTFPVLTDEDLVDLKPLQS